MRSKNLGQIPGLAEKFTKEVSLEVFKKMCVARFFELNAKKAYEDKQINIPIYLSLGQEAISAALAVSFPKPYIFAQYRSHDLYLAYGGKPMALVDELLSKPTGVAGGMGGSAAFHGPDIGMFGSDTLVGDHIPIAVGFALGKNEKTLATLGDAAAEEDYVLGAMAYAPQKKLPILFVCYDNDLAILTETKVRRSWRVVDVAKAFGMEAVEITDDPWLVMHHVTQLSQKLPAVLNIHTVRHLWHTGAGTDGPPEWNRFQMVKDEFNRLGWAKEAHDIEQSAEEEVKGWWTKAIAEKVKPQ